MFCWHKYVDVYRHEIGNYLGESAVVCNKMFRVCVKCGKVDELFSGEWWTLEKWRADIVRKRMYFNKKEKKWMIKTETLKVV